MDTDNTVEQARKLRKSGASDAACALLESALTKVAPNRKRALRLELHRALLEVGEPEKAEQVLSIAAGKGNGRARAIWEQVSKGEIDAARIKFLEILDDLPDHVLQAWMEMFDLLTSPNAVPVGKNTGPHKPLAPLIAVSGMGWSGSGAVFDYLADFKGVAPVSGENRIVEGRHSLRTLLRACETGSENEFRVAVNDLFRYTLVGIASCPDYEAYRHVRNARRAVYSPSSQLYVNACRSFLFELLDSHVSNRAQVVTEWAPRLLSAIARARLADLGQIPLLDNVIHIRNINLAKMMPQMTFFATVRDPRDQFLDNVRNKNNFHANADKFIKNYRTVRARLRKYHAGHPDRCIIVQFESFVQSQEYRDTVIKPVFDLGSLGRRNESGRFLPEVSRQNIQLWRNLPGYKTTLDKIAAELQEYLAE